MDASKENIAPPAETVETWKSARLFVTDKFDSPPVILRIDDSIVGTLGNFSASTGKAKSKKTFNVCAIVAAALTNSTVLSYTVSLPPNKRKILYVDTEQSPFHCLRLMNRILKLSNLPTDTHPEQLVFLGLRRYATKDRLKKIEEAIYETEGLGLVVIDGIRDLAHDINSPGESTDLITKLMQWTDEQQIHIHVVLHLNKGDDNTRGHLGTELNNKAETVLRIKVDEFDNDTSIVESMFIRDRDFEPFAFRINTHSLPELIENYQPQSIAKKKAFSYSEVSEEKHREALEAVFSIGEALSYGNLIEQLRSCYSAIGCECGIGKTKKLKQFLINKRMVIQGEDKLYRHNRDFYY
ncbi:AAA family ATPase [Parabacteroides sp. OttesenSCG-928-G07]|nr:AAA family ATPase [Parabacteroides sp. OttesenSCG-928-G07]